MQRAKLFGALFAYVNNIQITWKTIHLSVFCRTNSPSTDQSRAEGNNTECVGKKRFNGRVLPTGFGKSMCYAPPFWTSLIHVHRFCWWIHCKTQCPLAIQQQKGKIYANSVVDSSAELVSLPQNISAERKSVNKYYPPDWDPSKGSVNKYVGQHPLRDRAKKLSQGILVIRFELPYNIWCGGCNSHVGMGVRYNAEKSKVGNYYTTPIYKFRMKCHLCDNYFEIQTDPKNHDYVILCGARRKEQRWDPKDNEQIVPEDKATQKKLATDAMYKLEHGSDDKQRGESVIPTIGQITNERYQYKDDYIINKIARDKFRNEKKAIKAAETADKELLLKSSLDIALVKETDEDKKLAGLLKLRPTETYDEKQIQKRKEIESRPIFETVSPNSKESQSPFKGKDIKQIFVKSIALKKGSPFDKHKTTSDSSNQIRKMLGVKKRSVDKNSFNDDSSELKKIKDDRECDITLPSLTENYKYREQVIPVSKVISSDMQNKTGDACKFKVCDNKPHCDIDESQYPLNSCKSEMINSTSGLGLVSAYTDSESECSEG